jgi:hypothetical protein
MPDNQKTIVVEMKSWRRQTYYRRHITGMIASEGLQALQGPPSPGHVFCNRGQPDIEPELQRFAMNPHSPAYSRHGACQSSYEEAHRAKSRLTDGPKFHRPPQSKQ